MSSIATLVPGATSPSGAPSVTVIAPVKAAKYELATLIAALGTNPLADLTLSQNLLTWSAVAKYFAVLKNSGLYDLLDTMRGGLLTAADSLKDWKAPGNASAVNNSATWDATNGFQPDGTSTWVQEVAAPNGSGNYKLTDASFSFLCTVAPSTSSTAFLARGTGVNDVVRALIRNATSACQFRLNSVITTATTGITVPDCRGVWTLNRNGTTLDIWFTPLSGATTTKIVTLTGDTPSVLPDQFAFGRNNTAYTSGGVKHWNFGAHLTDALIATLHAGMLNLV